MRAGTKIIATDFPFALPRLICSDGEPAQRCYIAFFSATLGNTHTRRTYARATVEFFGWCSLQGVISLNKLRPLHVSGWITQIGQGASASRVKQWLTAVCLLLDRLVIDQIIPVNPATLYGHSHSG